MVKNDCSPIKTRFLFNLERLLNFRIFRAILESSAMFFNICPVFTIKGVRSLEIKAPPIIGLYRGSLAKKR